MLRGDLDHQRICLWGLWAYNRQIRASGGVTGGFGWVQTHPSNPPTFKKGTQLIENYKEKILNFNKNLFKKLFKINKKINLVNEKNYKINLIT